MDERTEAKRSYDREYHRRRMIEDEAYRERKRRYALAYYHLRKNDPSFIGPKRRRVREYHRRRRKTDRAFVERDRIRQRQRYVRHRFIVLEHYGKGGKMVCCWDACTICEPDLLTLDHIYGGGSRDRKANTGAKIFRRLIREGFPSGFQTLCWNHHRLKHAQAKMRTNSE